jgi:hypothetical protein
LDRDGSGDIAGEPYVLVELPIQGMAVKQAILAMKVEKGGVEADALDQIAAQRHKGF